MKSKQEPPAAIGEHKSQFLASMNYELRMPLNVIHRAHRDDGLPSRSYNSIPMMRIQVILLFISLNVFGKKTVLLTMRSAFSGSTTDGEPPVGNRRDIPKLVESPAMPPNTLAVS